MEDRNGAVSRRRFCQAALGLGGLTLSGCLSRAPADGEETGPLLPPIVTGHSAEICLNSRVSQHFGLAGTASDQQIANVLWAAGRAPVTGSHRTIYLRTGSGSFVYDPQEHALESHSGPTVPNAFRINYDRERDFDAGVSYMFALLASVSLWTGTTAQLASCPQVGDLNFGIAAVPGLTHERVAQSSDGSLPDPQTDGPDRLEDVLAAVQLQSAFRPDADLTPAQLSQVLWAGYGCTPHRAFSGLGGLTVPSWVAQYFLTNRIYVVDARVGRYRNRQDTHDGGRDHRLEPVQDADVRPALRAALPGLPAAPCYVLLCLTPSGNETWYQRLETGFAAGAMLVQAEALGLGCAFQAALSAAEQSALQQLAQLPADDRAHAVVAVGNRAD